MIKLLVSISALLFIQPLLADSPVSTNYWNNTAIGGYDSVSYHQKTPSEKSQPTIGHKKFVVRWNKADWHFSSQESANKFAKNPEKYRPEYNGHCSNALSLGEGLIPTKGSVWEFFGEKLHLFYAERGRQRWLKGNWKIYKKEADAAWKQYLKP